MDVTATTPKSARIGDCQSKSRHGANCVVTGGTKVVRTTAFFVRKLWWFVPAVPGCGMPPRMLHAFPVLPDDFQPNDEAEVYYNCSIGYYPVDSNMIWCDMNIWEGNITCLRKSLKKKKKTQKKQGKE